MRYSCWGIWDHNIGNYWGQYNTAVILVMRIMHVPDVIDWLRLCDLDTPALDDVGFKVSSAFFSARIKPRTAHSDCDRQGVPWPSNADALHHHLLRKIWVRFTPHSQAAYACEQRQLFYDRLLGGPWAFTNRVISKVTTVMTIKFRHW